MNTGKEQKSGLFSIPHLNVTFFLKGTSSLLLFFNTITVICIHNGCGYPQWIGISMKDRDIHGGQGCPWWIGISMADEIIHTCLNYPP